MAFVRSLVSKKKVRFQQDGFDLDLTYIRPNIIAMGFPSEGREASFRNPLPEVQRFFEARHKDQFRIYNLCSERAYDFSKFGGPDHCARYPFDDHNPAPLAVIRACCEDMHAWLSSSADHVVAVHCKAGKGRTGMMIAAYLVHSGIARNTTEALKMFGDVRTLNGKGVTIPSQMRYVHYYEQTLRLPAVPATLAYKLTHIRLITIPNMDVGGGCDPYFEVRLCLPKDPAAGPAGGIDMKKIFNWKEAHDGKVENFQPKHKYADLSMDEHDLRIKGDVKVVFFDYDRFSKDDKAFHFWFNTAFIYNNYLLLHKDVIDDACKDKGEQFDKDFKVELFFERVPEDDERDFSTVGTSIDDKDEDDEDGGATPAPEGAAGGGGAAAAAGGGGGGK